MIVTDPVHVDQWATFVTATKDNAHVRTVVVNQSERPRRVDLEVVVNDPEGRRVGVEHSPGFEIAPGKNFSFELGVPIPNPVLWNLDAPALYHATVHVRERRDTLDDDTVAFGIRDARFEADTGFWLNGKNFKIKGVCLHHDGGAFGAAVPLGVWERRLAVLQ